jgi:Ca2+-binding EF-hand superfamily protein
MGSPDDICDSKYNIGNIGNSQGGRGSNSLPSYNLPNNRNDRNDINDGNNKSYGNDRSYGNDKNYGNDPSYGNDRNTGNDRNDGNAYNDYEQKQFNDFLKKLMDVESNIENAKADLANNPDFNVEDAFKLFDKNDKAYITEEDLKNGLNSLGLNPTDQDVRLLMKRFDLQKSGKINYADFFDMIVPFKPELRNKIENKEPNQSSPSKSQEPPNEQTLNDLKNLFDLIIKSEKDINDTRKSFGTLRLNLRDIFGLLDKGGKGYFTVEELVDYLKKNGLFTNNQEADLLFIRLDKSRKGNIGFPEIEDEIQTLY